MKDNLLDLGEVSSPNLSVRKVSRRQYSVAEKKRYCEKWRHSKNQLTKEAFCRQERISKSALGRWLRSARETTPSVKLLAVEGVGLKKSAPELVLRFPNGVVLHLPWDSDKALAEWIKALVS